MKYILFILSVILGSLAQAQTYKWVRGGGTGDFLSTSVNEEETYFMCTDPNGNVYALNVVGNDPIVADTFYRPGAYGSSQNILFTSHNCNGQMRFAKLISGSEIIPHGVVSDNSGHIYVAFDGRHDAVSSQNLRIGYDTTISGDVYRKETLVQFDTTGNLNWLRFVGTNIPATYFGTGASYNYLALDGMNNPHLIAWVKYGVFLAASATTGTGYYDLNYDGTGSLLSVNKLQIDSTNYVHGATIDKASNKLYAYGYRNTPAYPDSSHHAFIAGLDLSRNLIWKDTLHNPISLGSAAFGCVIADGEGNLYASVSASRAYVYKGDTITNTFGTSGNYVASILKLDTSGNLKWTRAYSGSTGVNGLRDLTLVGDHKIAACGNMAGTIKSGADAITGYTGEGQNSWFTIVDTAGYVHTMQQIHGAGFYDWANAVAANSVGSLYVGGRAETSVWAGSLAPYTGMGGGSDYFILKYGVDCSCTSAPFANYTYSGSDLAKSFSYTGTSSGIDSVRWTFGDGSTSTSMSPTHMYTAAGNYTVCARVYSACGSDMHCKEVAITCAVAPVSSFIDTGVLVHGFAYTGTLAGYDSVTWTFGDGNTDTGLNVIHTYAVADTYHVCAKVYTNCGMHTFCKDIYINVPGLVSDASLAGVRVFPNPASDQLYVTGVDHTTSYRLINLVGEELQQGEFTGNTNIVSTRQLSPGMYILELTGFDSEKRIMRVIKQE